MSRLFSILVSLFILVLVYLWIGHIVKSGKPKAISNERVEQQEEPTNAQDVEVAAPVEEETIAEIEDVPIEDTRVESDDPVVEPKDPQPKTVASGGHLVIAGNFLERANAEKHLKTIVGFGYTNAEILQFEISQYYTVCAGRYNDPVEARRIAKRIEDMHGVDTYVRSGN